jgi:hypothetical protein
MAIMRRRGIGRAPAPAPAPAWRVGQDVNTWRRIAGSSLSNLAATQQTASTLGGRDAATRVNNWNGYAIASGVLWDLGNGGHGDWLGSAVNRLVLTDAAPEWEQWLPDVMYSEAWVSAGRQAQARHYDDSTRLTGQHSYYTLMHSAVQGRVLRIGTGSLASAAGSQRWEVDSFNPACAQNAAGSVAFDAAGTYDPINESGAPSGPTANCIDQSNGKVYVWAGNGACRVMTPTNGAPGGTWATAGSSPPAGFNGYEAATAFDTSRQRIFIARGNDGYQVQVAPANYFYFDVGANTYTDITGSMNGAGRTALNLSSKGCGMVYVPQMDAYYLRLGEISGMPGQTRTHNRIFKINAATWEVTALTPTVEGGETIAGAAQLDGTYYQYENVYSKLLFVPETQGVVYYPEYSSDLWHLRLY